VLPICEAKKNEYWNHFVTKMFVEGPRRPGATGARLRKAKALLWDDDDFWFDIVYRHGGEDMTPEAMESWDTNVYEHCFGNFWGMVTQTLVENGLLCQR
jgi:hypothetical protein